MPKKSKITGKTRLDKYYHLAKEQGFRSRAAFKLVQLNRKYDFLSGAKALIDLCAAPGGWLQVAAKYMPVSSLIVGVDLDPIKPIPNVQSFQEDITTASCRAVIKAALQHWKADVVLNDGSPNVGGAWTKDAYGQAELSLAALKLALDFLRPGGLFVTKVFRSQDSNSLLWVCRQLFNRVEVTKPSASRGTSAEIYFVCQGYKAPDKVDPRLLDPAFVFKAIDQSAAVVNVLRDAPNAAKRQRGGYADGVMLLHKTLSASDYLTCEAPAEILGQYNQITFAGDDQRWLSHSATTDDIRVACEDLKVLGRRDFRGLIEWRRALRKEMNVEPVVPKVEVVGEVDEEERVEKEIAEATARMEAKDKRARRKRKEQKMKARRRQLNMVNLEEGGDIEQGLFAIDTIATNAEFETIEQGEGLEMEGEDSDDDDDEGDDPDTLDDDLEEQYALYAEERGLAKKKKLGVGLEADEYADHLIAHQSDDDDEDDDDDDDDEDDDEGAVVVEDDPNPLMVDLSHLTRDTTTAEAHADRWFSGDLFNGVVTDSSSMVIDDVPAPSANTKADDDAEEFVNERPLVLRPKSDNNNGTTGSGSQFEIVPQVDSADEWTDDSETEAEMLALGKKLLRKRGRQDLEDASYNRYAFQDGDLPSWFADDQKTHNRPILPASKSEVDEMRARLAAVNARPIKKIAEAMARKKMAAVKRWEKVKATAENIVKSDMSEKDKMSKISALKNTKSRRTKTEKQYVVNRKNTGAQKVTRKKGARLKMVDTRMKADRRGRKASERKAKKSTTKKRRSS